MNTQLDADFKKIESLAWLPFVGDNYLENDLKSKVLIIGESHYYKPDEKNSLEKHLHQDFTRKIVQEMCFDREYSEINLFPNFHRAMMGNDSFDTYPFWNQYAFYNFVQRPMNMNTNERPSRLDFDNAWSTFFKLALILNPTRVLFLGNSSADRFNICAKRNGVDYTPTQWIKKIGSAYGKRAFLVNGDHKIQLDFIRHPSQYFSWEEWRAYLIEFGLTK